MCLEKEKVWGWLEELVGKELKYITNKKFEFVGVDRGANKVFVVRAGEEIGISFERIWSVFEKLKSGLALHIDTFLGGGGNDRSLIEAIVASFPCIGYMKGGVGRNKNSKNKVLQMMAEDIHPLGQLLDVSDEQYSNFLVVQQVSANNASVKINRLSKPFILLAGISGTGKTRFVRKQAQAIGSLAETYCLTAVRPDWHEPSDLLGYVSRLSGQEKYVATDVLRFIAKAWGALVDAGVDVVANANGGLCAQGQRSALAAVAPYWLCLDEMNLAPVEQYFADYLSALETREWSWEGEEFTYHSDALLKGSVFKSLAQPAQNEVRKELGLSDTTYDDLWVLIIEQGLSLPFNLIVAGTVNMDETTHGFSRKVIDRALTFDFGEFFPNNPAEFFAPTTAHKTLSYPLYSHAAVGELAGVDADGKLSIDFFEAVNAVLKNTPFELAFRALNELLLAVISEQPKDAGHLHAVWDDFLMCKVLPRIEGDVDKLGSGNDSVLAKLSEALEQQLVSCWADDAKRPDLFREQHDGSLLQVPCRSKAKLQWMQTRLNTAGFTSFWP